MTAPDSPDLLKRRLRSRTIEKIGRRGKYLLFELDSADTLVIHLRMTGRITQIYLPLDPREKPHLRLLIRFTDKTALAFHDTRRFGKAFLLAKKPTSDYWRKLGPEPLGRTFNNKYFTSVLLNRKRPIKSLLLDQAYVAGIGNIYADEALSRAGIHPLRPAGDLDYEEIRRLTRSIKATLRRAIELEGSSIDTYRDSRGRRGRFQETFRVHKRQGEPCLGRRVSVEKNKVGGRGTDFCPRCQR